MTSPVRQGHHFPGVPADAVRSPAQPNLEAGMAHITDLVAPHFTGHVGPVRFVDGHGETDDADLVAYFAADPDRYAVTATDEPPHDDDEPEGDDLEDEPDQE